MKRFIYFVLTVCLLAVFLISFYHVGSYYFAAWQNNNQYDALADLVESSRNQTNQTVYYQETETSVPSESADSDTPTETAPVILPEYAELYLQNQDLVGWIQIEDTTINYPVVQSPYEDDFYLRKGFDKEYNYRGCIYVSNVCDVFEPSDNVVIYGHNMGDGAMFGALDDYIREDFWKEHPCIIFNTLFEYHTYKIFAVFKTTATDKGFLYNQFIDASYRDEFDEYIKSCKDLAFYDTGIEPEYGDKLICLSTCEYTQAEGRLVVVAIRIS